MSNLSPGVTYTIEVQAYKDDQIGKPSTLVVIVPGKQLQPVPDLKAVLVNNMFVKLTWSQPHDLNTIASEKIEYGVYYGFTALEMMKGNFRSWKYIFF